MPTDPESTPAPAPTPKPALTSFQRGTAEIKERFRLFLSETNALVEKKYRQKDFYFVAQDGDDLQLWYCLYYNTLDDLDKNGDNETIWLLWDGKEVQSYDDETRIFGDFVTEQKSRRLESKFQYWTSPTTVSALLSILLLAFIFYLECLHLEVPQQLWSVFTAVIAFYFGRGSNEIFSRDGWAK